jgi:flagellar biosynthesis activator protein FlaF
MQQPTQRYKAYKDVQTATMSGRHLEASVLTKGAILLKNCQERWGTPGLKKELDEAIAFNQKIWTIFQSELAKPDNPLPRNIRENILSLARFIDRRFFQIMSSPSPEQLSAIININLQVAAGLRGSPTP